MSAAFSNCGRSYGKQACRMENEVVIAITRQVPTDVAVGLGIDRRTTIPVADDDVQAAYLGAHAACGALLFVQGYCTHCLLRFDCWFLA